MRFDLITLFPEMVRGFLSQSMISRASDKGILEIGLHQLRDWATDKHRTTDDRPFGGGAGMVLKPEPLFAAVEAMRGPDSTVIYMAPDGHRLTSELARCLSRRRHLLIISGHYQGIDQRVRDELIDLEVSVGDYVLTNGTLPAAVLVDCVSRYVPGVLGEENSLTQDSFVDSLLSFPQYTRPADFRGMRVPEVLLSGDHQAIKSWRDGQQRRKTGERRPDLTSNANGTEKL